MDKAGIEGVQASPKGLRHSYGVYAMLKGVPLHQLCKWMGHADVKTTAIYAQAVGEESPICARFHRALASRNRLRRFVPGDLVQRQPNIRKQVRGHKPIR